MGSNITLRMDDDLLKRLRHRAVDAGMSLSAWITKKLEELVPKDQEIDEAKARSLERMRVSLWAVGP